VNSKSKPFSGAVIINAPIYLDLKALQMMTVVGAGGTEKKAAIEENKENADA